MQRISALKLSDKQVVDSEGRDMCMLHNIIADTGTGLLRELVVKPADELDTSKFKREGDYILIPFGAVIAIRDVIVIDGEMIRTRA